MHAAYERRASATALPRMRALLSAHLLRRTKADPVVASQLQLPPVEWVTLSLTLAEAERAAYDAATADLRASYDAFARAVDAASNARSAQSRLDESRRRRGVDAREYASAGAFSSLAQARKLGELNGALTRVRQMLCSPFAVNVDKAKARKQGEAAVLASTTRLPHRTILERLVAQASQDPTLTLILSLTLTLTLTLTMTRTLTLSLTLTLTLTRTPTRAPRPTRPGEPGSRSCGGGASEMECGALRGAHGPRTARAAAAQPGAEPSGRGGEGGAGSRRRQVQG